MDKRALRREIFKVRDGLSPAEILAKSRGISVNLASLPHFQQSRTVMFFLAFRSEVDTRVMVEESLAAGKRVLVPKAVPETRSLICSQLLDWERDLAPGAYDIPEPRVDQLRPVEPREIDLLIVPGVAFDEQGNRLGYGGGYYDRFFPLLRPGVPLVALSFELQIVPAVPVESWDRPVDLIITEQRIIDTGALNCR